MKDDCYTDYYTEMYSDEGVKNVVVTGTRTFNNYDFLAKVLDALTVKFAKVRVVTGAARGADELAEKWAAKNWHRIARFHADWDAHGKGAGPKRNEEMLTWAGKNALVVAFWDGESPGTGDCISRAKRKGMKVKIVKVRKRVAKTGWRK